MQTNLGTCGSFLSASVLYSQRLAITFEHIAIKDLHFITFELKAIKDLHLHKSTHVPQSTHSMQD